MATIKQDGTEFTFSVLPPDPNWDGHWVKTRIAVKNEYINYEEISERLTVAETEQFLCLTARLLAGAFGKGYSFFSEKSGFVVDFYPYTEDGEEVDRTRRRQEDCIMAIRTLFKGKEGKFLAGIYTSLFHRAEIKTFLKELTAEFNEAYPSTSTDGKYLFVAVSPLGYRECKYWYLDATKTVRKGDYVWVRMGRRNTEQIVYVDEARYFDDETAPYDPLQVKQVLRKATSEEQETITDLVDE